MSLGAGACVSILELDGSGHRLSYVGLLAKHAVAVGAEAELVTTSVALARPEASVHLDMTCFARTDVLGSSSHSEVWGWLARNRGARVVVPDADRLLPLLLLASLRFQDLRISALVMRHPRHSSSWLKRGLKYLILAGLNSRPNVCLSHLISAGQQPEGVKELVDPTTFIASPFDVDRVRTLLGLSPALRWFAILGAVTARKSPDVVIRALSRVAVDQRIGLIVAGRIDSDVRQQLVEIAGETGHLEQIVIDRMLSEVELDALTAAVDCVVLAHRNEGPSGLLGKAIAAGTPVLAAGAESLRKDCQGYPLAHWVPLEVGDLERGARVVLAFPHSALTPTDTSNSFAHRLLWGG